MNKYFFVLALLASTTCFAQKKKFNPDKEHENFFRFGAKAGVNINKVAGASYSKAFRYNFQAGAFLQFNFSERYGLQPEVNFVQSSSELTGDASTISDDLASGDQHKAKLNYLEVPVLLNVNLGPSKRVKLQVGPSYGGLLKQTVDSLKAGSDIYKKSEWSAIGGIWFQLPVVNIGARYKYGLTNINGTESNKEKWHNQSIQIFVGLTF